MTRIPESAGTAAAYTVAQIRDMIRDGDLRAGDRLPSERALATRLQVSRNTVRDALHHFETLGIVHVRRGSGAYLADDTEALQRVVSARQMLERYNWREMIQARRVLECGIVRVAATEATRSDKVRLREQLDLLLRSSRTTDTGPELDRHIVADYNFHHFIAEITHNSILVELHAALQGSITGASEVWKRVPNPTGVTNIAHTAITEAIIDGRAEDAAAAMGGHLDHMEQLVVLADLSSPDF